MATHRVRENGHTMWFKSDEEYKEYRKKGCVRSIIGILIFIALLFIGYLQVKNK